MSLSDSPRRIAILGAGREGLAAQAFCQQRWPDACVQLFDDHPGRHASTMPAQWQGWDMAIKSPGIPPAHAAIRAIRKQGIYLTSGTSLFLKAHPQARVIAITGTKGKSTIASALYHVLQKNGVAALLGGNIGTPLLDLHPERGEFVVAELSSYQLHDVEGRFEVGLLHNLYPEHLDWHGDVTAYHEAKLRLKSLCDTFYYNGLSDTLVQRLGPNAGVVYGRKNQCWYQQDRFYFGEHEIGEYHGPLLGEHNRQNILAVLTLAKHCGVAFGATLKSLNDFQSLPHRLQKLGVFHDKTWVDDSISTTPRSTLAALQALSPQKVCVLIGGHDRGLDWTEFFAELPTNCQHIIAMHHHGRHIIDNAPVAVSAQLHMTENLEHAVQMAKTLDVPTVLLSPGAPSFHAYTDYRQRGQHFAELVQSSDLNSG